MNLRYVILDEIFVNTLQYGGIGGVLYGKPRDNQYGNRERQKENQEIPRK